MGVMHSTSYIAMVFCYPGIELSSPCTEPHIFYMNEDEHLAATVHNATIILYTVLSCAFHLVQLFSCASCG